MTTIATDGQTMAGDGLVVAGGTILSYTERKVTALDDGRLVGECGDSDSCAAFRKWIATESGDPPKLAEEFQALVLTPDGTILWYGEKCVSVELPAPQAIGSGMDFALAALDCGKSPAEAVVVAAKRNTDTGGDITVLRLKAPVKAAA